jgi:gamma-glutamyltranspeptidase / glutathione hydrolase
MNEIRCAIAGAVSSDHAVIAQARRENMRLITLSPPFGGAISKRRNLTRQRLVVAPLVAALTLAAGLSGCGGSKEQPGVVGTVHGFIGGAVADEPRAAQVARDVLSAGGTAADAAVALYFTLAVTLPSTATLGGGGVCVVYDGKANRGQVLDFAPRAPAGGGPIALPSAVRGMFALYAQSGKLRWEQLIAPAEDLARFGTPVSRALAADLLAAAPKLAADPGLAKLYLKPDGTPYKEGDRLVQSDLSTVLSAIRSRGAGAGEFYTGPVAREFVRGAQAQGAKISLDDLRGAPFAWRPAVIVKSDGMLVYFPSPPAVAGVLEAQMWSMAQPRWKDASADERPHLFAQATLRAWLDRQRWLAGDFKVNPPPPELIDKDHIKALMASYQPGARTVPQGFQPKSPGPDDAAGSSFVVVDRTGSAVSCTVTPYDLFGAGSVATGTGIVLAAAPDEARGRGPQWLGPMIAVRDFSSFLSAFTEYHKGGARETETGESAGSQFVFGGAASGGAAASSALVEVALRALIEGRPLDEASDAQRLHVETEPVDTVFVETGVQPRPPGLVQRGYNIVPVPVIGRVNAIACPGGAVDRPQSCAFRADRRGFGLAAGGF